MFCRVAIDSGVLALDRPFDYLIPERMRGRVGVGSVVRVPLHGRRVRAFVTDLVDQPAVADPKPLSALLEPALFGSHEIALARFVAERYVVSLGAVLHDSVPGRYSLPAPARAKPPPRTARPSWLKSPGGGDARETVHVVPAAREDELIAHLAGETAAAGRRALVVCPRVQTAQRIAERIGGAALLYGEQRPGDRAAAWAGARDGTVHVVVGGRAALLAPVAGLGLVAVASAHDRGLRSQRSPRSHALVVARKRAELTGARFVASSPTPPLELVAGDANVVETKVRGAVRTELQRPRREGPVTPRLVEAVRSAVERGSDALVFAGRIGGVLRLRCTDCGWYARCQACGVALPAPFGGGGMLECRLCGTESPTPDECPSCGGELSPRGWGHSRIASALERALPGVSVVRLVGGDEVAPPSGPAVVVGTLAAAHGWPRPFGAVCVADLDQQLARPDVRAAEHALGTLHELAASLDAGGRFLLQTREPDHHVVQAFTRQSFSYFAQRELPLRREAGYPPYGEIVLVRAAFAACDELAPALRDAGATVLGPAEDRGGAGKLLVRAPALEPLLPALRAFALAHPRAQIDVDPVDVV